MADYDVVVCGGGVGGLALGAALCRQRLRVLVVDKQPRHAVIHKGELLQPRSLQILDALGALRPLQARGALPVDLLECRTADGGLIGALDYRLLGGAYNFALLHYYGDIKTTLAAAGGIKIRFGHRVDGLLREPDGRVCGVRLAAQGAKTEVTCRLTVGADGRTSAVRAGAGLTAAMSQYGHQLLAFDLTGAPALGRRVTAFLTAEGLRLLYPMPGGRARLYVQLRQGEFREIRRRGVESWTSDLLATPGLRVVAEPLLASASRTQVLPAWRFNAATWIVPGLALVGDAAHCVHPMAGQGMNAAIGDAWVLGEAIRGAVSRCGPGLEAPGLDAALERYERERRPQLDYVIRLSHNLARIFTDTSPLARAVTGRALRSNRFNRRLQYRLTYNMSGLGVRRFTWRDRLYQFGLLPDPHASEVRL